MKSAARGSMPRAERGARRALIVAMGLAMGLVCFLFRVLSERGLTNDHYMHMAWAQQLLLGEVPGRDFVDPGMPLTYGLSAAVQYVWPGPFSEMALSSVLLALAAAATAIVAARMTGSIVAGVGAALFEIALQPRFYSAPKILVPSVALLALWSYFERPGRWRLGVMSAWTVVATLLRHDLGVYAGVAAALGLIVGHGLRWRDLVRALAGYVGMGVLLSVPYLLFVQATNGLTEHTREATEFSKGEAHQLQWDLPDIPAEMLTMLPTAWNAEQAATFLAILIRLLVPLTLVVLAVRWRHLAREHRAMVVALVVLLACFAVIILRHPLVSRVSDTAAVLALAGAWVGGQVLSVVRAQRPGVGRLRRALTLAGAALVAGAIGIGATSVSVLEKVSERVSETRVGDGLGEMREMLGQIAQDGTTWPWDAFWPNGALPDVVAYISACTAPSDRLYLTWAGAEYYFFTRRGFASGHSMPLAPRAFTSARDQEKMLARFTRVHVPVVLINETTREEFARTYPLVDDHIRRHYAPVGRYTIRGDSETIAVSVRTDETATGTYGPDSWPCGFVTGPRAASRLRATLPPA